MWWQRPYNPTGNEDDWEGQPKQGAFFQWGLGVVVPLGICCYGVSAIILRRAVFSEDQFSITFHGVNAIAFGAAWVCAAVFLHCHYFWGNVYDQAWFAVLGKIVSACGFISGLVVVLLRNGILGKG